MPENDASLKRGAARMRELATEDRAKREALEEELSAGLGRTPAAIDKLTINAIAATQVRALRLRQAGRSDLEERRLLTQLLRTSGLRPAPASAPAPLTIAQQLAAAGYAPPTENGISSEFDDGDGGEEPSGEAALSEAESETGAVA